MTALVDALWLRLQAVLKSFADGLVAADPTLMIDIGRSTNEAFLLRVYLSLQRQADGDEIAITVDARRIGEHLALESDVCADDGEVVAAGPSALIPLAEGQVHAEAGIGDWLREFERFLMENDRAVVVSASKLS